MLLVQKQNETRKLACVHICFDKKQFSYYIICCWTCGGRVVFFTKWWSILRLVLSNSHRIEKTITVWLWGPVLLCQNLHHRVAVWWNIRGGGDTRGAANIARIMQRTRAGKCVRLKMCVIIVEEQYPPPVGSRWVMSSPLCHHLPLATSWHLSHLYCNELHI